MSVEDLDEVESSRTERFLGFVLGVFLLIGGGWLYWEIGHWLPVYPNDGGYLCCGPPPTDDTHRVVAALLRLALVVIWLAASIAATLRLRARNSRMLPLAWGALLAGAVLGLVFGAHYTNEWLGADFGPLALSLMGSALTIFGFWRLQRFLAQRVPERRVRKGECPFCGYPIRGSGAHCEGCGRAVVTACSSCGVPRRTGSRYCASCGEA